MKLNPFLLDQWLAQKHPADPSIEFDLGSSTGPIWTLRELLELGGDVERLLDTIDRLRAILDEVIPLEQHEATVATGCTNALNS